MVPLSPPSRGQPPHAWWLYREYGETKGMGALRVVSMALKFWQEDRDRVRRAKRRRGCAQRLHACKLVRKLSKKELGHARSHARVSLWASAYKRNVRV
jgi:hypothetical protein